MLGRGIAERLRSARPEALVSPEVVEAAGEADLFVLNLECCVSERGSPWPAPGKPFFFRAPPVAVEVLSRLGVDCVTLANNHALDFGEDALMDTLGYLSDAGIATVGAGPNVAAARASVVLRANGLRLGVVGVADHPRDFAAGTDRPGIAFADLRRGVPPWLLEQIDQVQSDAVLVTPHWGPNMSPDPVPHVRAAVPQLLEAGTTLIAGHSSHVFQAVDGAVLYDLGDFLDDYAVDPLVRNDLGLLWLVTLDDRGPVRLEAVPLKLDFCHTRLADSEEAAWIRKRFVEACAAFGTEVSQEDERLVVSWD
jgi:poly-gamma-glutamate capsule biosynthesis protein CapA/YwtB (metallophosphatase superfamily)